MSRKIVATVLAGIMILQYVPIAGAQVGDISPVHDPCVIRQNDTFYLFSSGQLTPVRTSTDLIHWKPGGTVFTQQPEWAQRAHPAAHDIWAPDISFTNGEYRLYYAISTDGSRESTIALATNVTLDPADPKFHWIDHGPVITTHDSYDWNAIDPAAFTDASGQVWLSVGSYWSGIKLFKLDAATGMIVAGDQPRALAARDGDHSVEGSFLTRRGDWYYLWTSFDKCNQGINSNYNVRVGRSKTIEGPYVDAESVPLLKGGGKLVLASYGDVRGPGHCAVLHDGQTDYLVHHWYDAAQHGRSKLGIEALTWDDAGWPHAGPMLAPTTAPAISTGPPHS